MELLFLIIIVFLITIGLFIFKNFNDTHISKVVINKPFEMVWPWVSNPLRYSQIYPHWIKNVTQKSEDVFSVQDQFGSAYDIKLIKNKEFGVVDLMIGSEKSSARLISIDEGRTIMIHIAKRWEGCSFLIWFFHKITTDKDLKYAKNVIEK